MASLKIVILGLFLLYGSLALTND